MPWWKRLQVLLVVAGAVLAAMVAVVNNLDQLTESLRHLWGDVVPPRACYAIVPSYYAVVPYSLVNSVGNQKAIYWFHLGVTNDCPHNLYLSIVFEVRNGPATVNSRPIRYTMFPKTKTAKDIDPGFLFTKDDVSATLQVTWIIRNEKEDIIYQDTDNITVLPKDVFDWTLATPQGTPVSKDFLLASLVAWTASEEPQLKSYAACATVRTGGAAGLKAAPNKWFAQCYTLFRTHRVRVVPLGGGFPPKDQQHILTPLEVLQTGQATPLEAGLLLRTLARQVRGLESIRMVLLMQQSVTPSSPVFFLAWSTSEGDWAGLDMQQVSTLSFEDNLRDATRRVRALLKEGSAVSRALHDKGVFFSEHSGLAIDFATAADYYHVGGLP